MLTEPGLSGTPCVYDIRGQHPTIFVFPVLFFNLLVKTGFDLIEEEVVIKRLTKWQISVYRKVAC